MDISDPHHVLKSLTRICILADLTLVLAWSPEEAGKILETYKSFESKPADKIMEKSESSIYLQVKNKTFNMTGILKTVIFQLVRDLASIKPINKTDAMTLLARFKTLEGIIQASEFQLAECFGLGPRKAKKLYNTLHEKFCRN